MSTSKSQSPAERVRSMCKTATLNATRDDTIRFGAPVSSTQFVAVESFLKGRDILKFLACSERQLRAYSRNEISYAQLPVKTQQRLRQISDEYAKPWARKSATIAYVLLRERKSKRASKAKVVETVNAE